MNVAFDPWIPVVTLTGERKLASLCEVFTDGSDFADLAVRPHERVSLMRLFLCVAHAALDGPKDSKEWKTVPRKLPQAARKYLKEWEDSFELFHKKKPWLQVAAISKRPNAKQTDRGLEDWTTVSKFNFSFASGNNSTLFDHSGGDDNRNLPIEETIISMLSFQCFSPGGLISQVFWNRKQSKKTSKDGPCIPASMVHTIIRGATLFETICLNLITFDDVRRHYGKYSIGKPVWEIMPTSFNDAKKIQNATESYLGRLAPLTRLVKLHPSAPRMLLGDGLVYSSFADGFPAEPTATVIIRRNKEKEERAILSYRPSKAIWRELGSIIVKRKAGETGGALALHSLQDADDCDVIVASLARDQANIVETVESVFHVPSKLRSSQGAATYEAEVKVSETVSTRLGWAVEEFRSNLDGGWEGKVKSAGASKGELLSKLRSTATSHYWTTVEKNLSLLMAHVDALGSDAITPTRSAWRRMLISCARESYELACGQETPREIRAFAKGWQKLVQSEDYLETILRN